MLLQRSLLLALALLALGSAAQAQKMARTATECPEHGFQLNAIDEMDAVPVDSRSEPETALKFRGDNTGFFVHAFESQAAKSSGGKERTVAKGRRRDIISYLKPTQPGFESVAKKPTIDETVEIDGQDCHHRRFVIGDPENEGRTVDVWSFSLKHADIHLVYVVVDDEFDRRWEKATKDSAESFKEIERVVPDEVDTSQRTYEDQLAWAEQEAEKTPGWYAVGTPSERFVILTNAEKKAFVNEVIERLEISRDIYEQDFPPPANFKAVSVIRICKDREEFQRFSGTGGGVAGYFSPSSVELVLYDNVETDRNSTYAVVSHEAFHQYCHFLFNQSEAHRWFDEGHGDYYGGMKITGKRGKITPKMPSGLDRLSVIREMVRSETYKPLSDHLNFNHSQWQSQGPSNVSCYAQSWSVIYMLRQGALRKVSRKVWKDEYADIIPNYVRTLNAGFQAAYDEIRQDRIKQAEQRGKELTPEELIVTRVHLDPREKKKIWDAAMTASWGQIDLDEFQENWLLYVEKYVK